MQRTTTHNTQARLEESNNAHLDSLIAFWQWSIPARLDIKSRREHQDQLALSTQQKSLVEHPICDMPSWTPPASTQQRARCQAWDNSLVINALVIRLVPCDTNRLWPVLDYSAFLSSRCSLGLPHGPHTRVFLPKRTSWSIHPACVCIIPLRTTGSSKSDYSDREWESSLDIFGLQWVCLCCCVPHMVSGYPGSSVQYSFMPGNGSSAEKFWITCLKWWYQTLVEAA